MVDNQKPDWSESHHRRIKSYLERDVFPYLGMRDTKSIEAPELIPIIMR